MGVNGKPNKLVVSFSLPVHCVRGNIFFHSLSASLPSLLHALDISETSGEGLGLCFLATTSWPLCETRCWTTGLIQQDSFLHFVQCPLHLQVILEITCSSFCPINCQGPEKPTIYPVSWILITVNCFGSVSWQTKMEYQYKKFLKASY